MLQQSWSQDTALQMAQADLFWPCHHPARVLYSYENFSTLAACAAHHTGSTTALVFTSRTRPWFHKKSSLLHGKVRSDQLELQFLQKRRSLGRKKNTQRNTSSSNSQWHLAIRLSVTMKRVWLILCTQKALRTFLAFPLVFELLEFGRLWGLPSVPISSVISVFIKSG